MRRAIHTYLQPKAAKAYHPLQMAHARTTVFNILDDPYNFQKHATALKLCCAVMAIVRKTHDVFQRSTVTCGTYRSTRRAISGITGLYLSYKCCLFSRRQV
ncbi:hypothetical protein EDB19DRAFT_1750803 [Suillus lakei]|nr:hypothetical protein EDB19DRAFT_1750803 [Suillus lakei]